MRKLSFILCSVLFLTFVLGLATISSADDHGSIVIVFKDGHRQSFPTAEMSRIDLKAPATITYKDGRREKIEGQIDHFEFATSDAKLPGRSHFVGKWEAGQGGGGGTFYITLEENGDAKKSIGATHGTWNYVDGEARISWDDGWHDIIRKVGTKHQKIAFEPGHSFSDEPSNVTTARNTQPKPI